MTTRSNRKRQYWAWSSALNCAIILPLPEVRVFVDTACFGIGACCSDGIATLCGGAATCATLLGATVVLRCVCVVERDIVCDT
jgi:hypothetical protein